ncbi:PTS IIA-like nitrogen-regulatory protein PtsN [Alkalibacterium sp. AK22]|uniref:PTS sugar transporter subunit IIA n=1 Tax=Alkalibacterium sp. AK22 TaxID=1229520 RepID=UPI000448C96A|nr:PTS sugar transporter subunit IIA [Alkalibacterium sp. AK22]EXJ24308.1 PTS IIA-like nitrogen-regulatory protein PtsN [Alkalibacterium sp. AK22]
MDLNQPSIYASVAVEVKGSKKDVLQTVIEEVRDKSGSVFDASEVLKEVLEREALSTTGFGNGFAIPHGKSSDLSDPLVAVVKLADPVEWEAMDDEQVDILIMLIVPKEGGAQSHLKLLSQLSYNLMDEEIQNYLRKAESNEDLVSVVSGIFSGR